MSCLIRNFTSKYNDFQNNLDPEKHLDPKMTDTKDSKMTLIQIVKIVYIFKILFIK